MIDLWQWGAAGGVVCLGALAAWVLVARRRVHWTAPRLTERRAGLTVRDSGGAGDCTVVLLHGLAGSGRYFGAEFEALAPELRVVIPDLLGFARSPRPTDIGYLVDDHVDAILGALAEIEVTGDLVVVGHSTGCVLALAVARAVPERVRAVVGFGPAVYRDAAHARGRLEGLGLMTRLFLLDSDTGQRMCQWSCRNRARSAALAPLLRPDLPAPIARDGVEHNSYSRTLRHVIVESASLGWLREATYPVHFVVGSRDEIPDLDALTAASSELDVVSVEVWPGDHNLPLTDPERCCQLIRSSAG